MIISEHLAWQACPESQEKGAGGHARLRYVDGCVFGFDRLIIVSDQPILYMYTLIINPSLRDQSGQ